MKLISTNFKTVQRASFAGFFLLLIVCVTLSPLQAQAQVPVIDSANLVVNTTNATAAGVTAGNTTANTVLGYTLNPLAWFIAKAVLNSLVQSTVKWINSGFKGAPAFATNLNTTLLNTSNSTANSFVQQLMTNGAIKSPFQNLVGAAVASAYNTNTNGGFFAANPYTLNQVTPNDAAFLGGNFSQGGFNAWFSEISTPANNPYGAYQAANHALNNQTAAAVNNQKTELNWGKGFLSFKGNCNSPTSGSTGSTGSTGTTGTSKTSSGPTANLSGTNTCSSASIQTPGSVIESQLEKSLGTGVDQLVTASQFNEIVNALIGQLTKQVLGGGGLAGVSQPTASGSSYLDQISAAQNSNTGTLSTSFSQTVSTQITQLQQFVTEWTSIKNAALAAQTALSSSTCYPNAQQVLATTVIPVVNQAESELAKATSGISALNNIQSESNSSASSNTTAGVTQASANYSSLLTSNTLPTATDLSYAQAQSIDTGASTSTTPTLLTQMNQLATAATSCTAPVTPPTGT